VSQADDSRLDIQVGSRHQAGRPYHFPTPSQDERIRRVFALADDVPLPAVSDQTLAAYHEYLLANLSLPFDALYCPTGGEMRQLIHYVHVTELTDPRQGVMHNLHGLYCRASNAKEVLDLPLADLGVREDNPNCQLIDDYAYWFVNWR
jgi:hypothetical protein